METVDKKTVKPVKALNKAEIFVSQSLRIGVVCSAAVILLGLLIFLSGNGSGYPGESYPTTLKDIVAGTLQMKSFAIILTGLVLLIFTPILRVGASIVAFLQEKDWLYMGISSFVFLILVGTFLFGK
jgi:Predicted membrane protein